VQEATEALQPESHVNWTLIQYQIIKAIFGPSPIEGTTTKEKAIYINKARMSKYPIVLIGPPLTLSRLISFSDADVLAVHFRTMMP